jgi:hypothetical protein
MLIDLDDGVYISIWAMSMDAETILGRLPQFSCIVQVVDCLGREMPHEMHIHYQYRKFSKTVQPQFYARLASLPNVRQYTSVMTATKGCNCRSMFNRFALVVSVEGGNHGTAISTGSL